MSRHKALSSFICDEHGRIKSTFYQTVNAMELHVTTFYDYIDGKRRIRFNCIIGSKLAIESYLHSIAPKAIKDIIIHEIYPNKDSMMVIDE